ncbi:MAG: hypothetical protein PUE41_06480, partial [bacterium]|nr:hypothetical protein [bacterium]
MERKPARLLKSVCQQAPAWPAISEKSVPLPRRSSRQTVFFGGRAEISREMRAELQGFGAIVWNTISHEEAYFRISVVLAAPVLPAPGLRQAASGAANTGADVGPHT